MFIVHVPELLITAPFCMMTGDGFKLSNTPCVVGPLTLTVTLSNVSALMLYSVSPEIFTTDVVPAPIKEPPLKVVPPDNVKLVPVARLIEPELVVAPDTLKVPELTLTVPVLVRLLSVCAVVVVSVPALLNMPPEP